MRAQADDRKCPTCNGEGGAYRSDGHCGREWFRCPNPYCFNGKVVRR